MSYHEEWCDIFDGRPGYSRCCCDAMYPLESDPTPAVRVPSARELNLMFANPPAPLRCIKCGGPGGVHDPACVVRPDTAGATDA